MPGVFFLAFLLVSIAQAGHLHPEKYYQEKWCKEHKGVVEFVLPDFTRVDCLTRTHAIEFDFAKKRDEALGQALRYSRHTGKRAGVVLIVEEPDQKKYTDELRETILYHQLKVDVWTTNEDQ